MESKNVTFAKLHEPIFVPNTGQVGPTLVTSTLKGKSDVSSMTYDGQTLTVTFSTGVQILVPAVHTTHMIVAKG